MMRDAHVLIDHLYVINVHWSAQKGVFRSDLSTLDCEKADSSIILFFLDGLIERKKSILYLSARQSSFSSLHHDPTHNARWQYGSMATVRCLQQDGPVERRQRGPSRK